MELLGLSVEILRSGQLWGAAVSAAEVVIVITHSLACAACNLEAYTFDHTINDLSQSLTAARIHAPTLLDVAVA